MNDDPLFADKYDDTLLGLPLVPASNKMQNW